MKIVRLIFLCFVWNINLVGMDLDDEMSRVILNGSGQNELCVWATAETIGFVKLWKIGTFQR
jgi:hypothetical protein